MGREPLDHPRLLAMAAQIRLLVLDIDGVLTDGRLHFDAEGREFKSFHVRDGYGIRMALEAGVQVAVISGRGSAASAARMRELRVPHVLLGIDDKRAAFTELVAGLGVGREHIACVGDDVTDLELMARAGLGIAVADAHPRVLAAAAWCTSLPGGRGAVREVCDLIVGAQHRA